MLEPADAPYLVPTHLREGQTIGPIPVRVFFVVLGVGLVAGAPVATLGKLALGDGGLWLGLLPVVLASPFALPWLDPPAEHGFLELSAHIGRNLWRALCGPWRRPPRRSDIQVQDGAVWVPVGDKWLEPRAVYRVGTVNLATASAETRRSARARWGGVLNALPHPIQIVIRSTPATTLPVLERIAAHGSPEAHRLAAWLTAHLPDAQLVDRDRYLVVPAEDQEQLADRCAALEPAMQRIGLPLERISAIADLAAVLGPLETDNEAPSGHLVLQGAEYTRAFDLGRLPPAIVTDWAGPMLDGDLPLDMSIDIEPLSLAWAKLRLDARRNALESSSPTPGRLVAVEQIAGLRMAYERRTTLPMRLQATLVVRGPDRATLERRTRRLRQRCKDLGAELRLLRWKQRAGWLSVLPMRRQPLRGRGLPVETGTVARTYPFSAGTLQLEGGVPFGVAASAPVTFTVVQARRAGRKGWRHMCWHGSTGSGKGYQLRVYLSREHFANGLRVYVIDQDEQQEYAGRFCAYLGGSTVSIRNLGDAERFSFDQVANPNVVVWDLHESDEAERGAIFATLKANLCAYQLSGRKRRMALVVDEAITVTEDELGRKALGDLARRGRHFGVELHVLTQRVSDWFDTQIGRAIQSTTANQWYGQMEDVELREIVEHGTVLSDEEQEHIRRAGQGEGLLVTAGRRVWVSLYGHTSPEEFEAFNTDHEEATDADVDDEEDQANERRNGHVVDALAAPAGTRAG
jgi:hypothetical protein